ncbi:MAG: HAMP domain-containing sensor histidine kinase [Hyphomonadaceae bacterium]|nr:HAMP domain-containing sensor histidine kinase [Hyphomonadaceae bacterium]
MGVSIRNRSVVAHDDERRVRGALGALQLQDAAGLLSVEEVVGIVVRGTWGRLGFALFIAVIATAVLPWRLLLGWAVFMSLWELIGRRWLDGLAIKLSRESQNRGVLALAIIHFFGGCAYGLFPFMAWSSQTPIGMVLATGWVCAAATHAFVYFASHRLILVAVLVPIIAMAVVAPFAPNGLTPLAAIGAATLSCLVLSAGIVGQDRVDLLNILAGQIAARSQAEEADRAKSQFLATMSHELRTPLNAIIGYAEMIEEEADGVVKQDAGKITVSARQLLGVINSLLDVSKLEAGAVEIEHETVRVAEIVDQMREAAAPLAATNNNKLIFQVDDELGEARLDHARVHQCVMQLIANAAKFTRDGVIRVAISERSGEGRRALQFVVADTGVGVPENQRERIFEPFTQVETEAGRRFEGAGLGLTFARRVARLMGGDVTCSETPGGGATFTFWVAV